MGTGGCISGVCVSTHTCTHHKKTAARGRSTRTTPSSAASFPARRAMGYGLELVPGASSAPPATAITAKPPASLHPAAPLASAPPPFAWHPHKPTLAAADAHGRVIVYDMAGVEGDGKTPNGGVRRGVPARMVLSHAIQEQVCVGVYMWCICVCAGPLLAHQKPHHPHGVHPTSTHTHTRTHTHIWFGLRMYRMHMCASLLSAVVALQRHRACSISARIYACMKLM